MLLLSSGVEVKAWDVLGVVYSGSVLTASNQSLVKLLQAQSARLERLEQIASGQLSSLGDRASSF